MLTLGIPGDTVTSVMLGALTLVGVTPGPQLFVNSPAIIYAIFAGMIVIQFLMLGFGALFSKFAPKVLKIPTDTMMPLSSCCAWWARIRWRTSRIMWRWRLRLA